PYCALEDTSTDQIYTLSLHDALPIFREDDLSQIAVVDGADDEIELVLAEEVLHLPHDPVVEVDLGAREDCQPVAVLVPGGFEVRSEEHTSELQSRENLVCRLLLEKKK